tara:strand:+ start:84 stop:263 length:180 start_codon:yes stop_codon:yes gene_type:complete
MATFPLDEQWRPTAKAVLRFQENLAIAEGTSKINSVGGFINGANEFLPNGFIHINKLLG